MLILSHHSSSQITLPSFSYWHMMLTGSSGDERGQMLDCRVRGYVTGCAE